MPYPFPIDFKNPDYVEVFRWRAERLIRIKQAPKKLPGLFQFYADNPIDFIEDWGMTFDPRNVGTKIPAAMPFILFPRQRELLEEVLYCWQTQQPLIVEKSRDVGASWLMVALGVSLCMFRREMVVGYGSRKEEYVDKNGSPKALFFKARQYLQMLPKELRRGWDVKKHAAHMRISFPGTNSVMTGEAGDNIGRGDRTGLYLVDESAHLARPELVDASLSATTNCRIDLSSVNGPANPFAVKRHSGRIRVFTFNWFDDPRKDALWLQKQERELDPIVVAQEILLSYTASIAGLLFPAEWVAAALDAHIKLGFGTSGAKRGALDVADEGRDKNAFTVVNGTVIRFIEQWSGKGSDIYETVEKAFDFCDFEGLDEFDYDSDGLGAGCRGDARKINEARVLKGLREIEANPWRGSSAVANPTEDAVPGRTNEDFYENAKAQGWFGLRAMFRNTYRAVHGDTDVPLNECISISSEIDPVLRAQLISELGQISFQKGKTGKMQINKAPPGTKSPNIADTVCTLFAPRETKKLAGILF